ncbi:di-heme oxidoredictase family protein [Halomonas sp. MMSF_3323]|uniref:di-heme oxidoreductase family protein n=1 Tax=Halomonas sp. MMSF_3323 TaxID=3046701 RepID=UPI00273F6F3A|nr:di-heme oxidoredictase family protein [Halomonas sp. MMSF_3323]
MRQFPSLPPALSALLAALVIGAPVSANDAPVSANDSPPIQNDPRSGGEGSVSQFDHNAYSLPLGNMSMTKRLDFSVGNSFFRNPWVVAPASTDARDGLGPLINTNSCQGCHIKDGRGHPPAPGEAPVSLFLRLSLPAESDEDHDIVRRTGAVPVPHYGRQLQTAAIPGATPEADMVRTLEDREISFDDGHHVVLAAPVYSIENPAYGELPENLLTSPRVAPPMIGLGLLEVVDEAQILAWADEQDADGDGISGRPNRVWDVRQQTTVLGRFGWKAGEPTVEQQSLHAFAGDMGLTSRLTASTDCMPGQGCENFPDGGDPEVSDEVADFITFYASSLAVPERRDMDSPDVQAGARHFNTLGCASCHRPSLTTPEDTERAELAGQTLWAYTDMLLHDMGEGLADGRPEYQADGNEWRTPPLWGLGLAQSVNPQAGFLHDGRARTLEEAILWHAGEAESSRNAYKALEAHERQQLLDFLNSL